MEYLPNETIILCNKKKKKNVKINTSNVNEKEVQDNIVQLNFISGCLFRTCATHRVDLGLKH